MTEMLGVLAIIGVLSIGGMVAYRMAMNRYYTNALISLVNKVDFAYHELCLEKEQCLFKWGAESVENVPILCNNYDPVFCGKPNAASWVKTINNILYRFQVTANKIADLQLLYIKQETCVALVQQNWQNIKYIYVGDNPALSVQQKETLIEQCQNSLYSPGYNGNTIRLTFKP